MSNLFTLFGTIAVNADSANRTIDSTTRNAEHAGSRMGNAFNKIGSFAVSCGKVIAGGLAVGATAIGALMKGSLESFAEYEQLVGGIETLFGESNMQKVLDYANQAYKTAGMSANEYMETVTSFSASLLQGLGGDTERAADYANMAITDMSDNANKMGTDISMIQNAYQGFAKQNYTMLDNLKLGYGGTAEEMARLVNDSGVLGAAITVDAKSLKQVPFHKIIDAINVIQDRMGIAGTTLAEATDTISGSFSALGATWTNLLTGLASGDQDIDTLVDNFLQAGETLATNVFKVLPRLMQNMGKAASRLMQSVGKKLNEVWTGSVWPWLQKTLKAKLGIELPSWSDTVDKLTIWWNSTTAYQKIKDIFKWTLGAFTNPEGSETADGSFWTGVKNWWTETVQPILSNIMQWTFFEFVVPAWSDFVTSVSTWWTDEASPYLTELATQPITIKFPTWDELVDQATTWWESIKSGLEALCKFYATYDINRTYTPEELAAANAGGHWEIDTVAGATTPVFKPADGSHANGLEYVPHNGYRALLHEGEAVLNSREANEWRSGNVGSADAVAAAVREAMGGIQFNVMLDSGALVGQLAPQMDASLGALAGRKGRRN